MKLRFTKKQKESGDVWSFFFDVPKNVVWTPGQSIRIEIPRGTWGYDERRFTIASTPVDGYIQITTRLSGSDFKNLLDSLKPGEEIDGHNIEGNFVWQDGPKLFIAIGVGITPFRAILRHQSAETMLLYASKDEPAVYQDELAKELGDNLQLTKERINLAVISDFAPDWQKRTIYISGPEKAVANLYKELGGKDRKIKTDLFTGNL